MSKLKLTLPGTEIPTDGKSVSFRAPCNCSDITCLTIDDVDYTIVDSLGQSVAGKNSYWVSNSVVTVTLDVTNKKAYIQGAPSAPSPMFSYLAFVGNVNEAMVSAAFGANNEDRVSGVGEALAMYGWYKGDSKSIHKFSKLQNMLTLNDMTYDIYGDMVNSTNILKLVTSNNYAKNKIFASFNASTGSVSDDEVINTTSFKVTANDLLHPFVLSYNLSHKDFYPQNTKVFINGVLVDSMSNEDNIANKSASFVKRNWKDFNITKPGTYTITARAYASNWQGNSSASITIYKAKDTYTE